MPGRNDGSDASGGPAAADAETASLKAEVGSLSEQIIQLTTRLAPGLQQYHHARGRSPVAPRRVPLYAATLSTAAGSAGVVEGAPRIGSARDDERYPREPYFGERAFDSEGGRKGGAVYCSVAAGGTAVQSATATDDSMIGERAFDPEGGRKGCAV